jgi:hypothetical protein
VQAALEPVPPPVVHDVLWLPWAVELVGFTPACEALAFASAPPCVELSAEVVAAWSFFIWPGASAEFPGDWEAEPLPFPLPARAEPANDAMPRTSTSTIVLASAAVRFVISFSPRFEQHFRGT